MPSPGRIPRGASGYLSAGFLSDCLGSERSAPGRVAEGPVRGSERSAPGLVAEGLLGLGFGLLFTPSSGRIGRAGSGYLSAGFLSGRVGFGYLSAGFLSDGFGAEGFWPGGYFFSGFGYLSAGFWSRGFSGFLYGGF